MPVVSFLFTFLYSEMRIMVNLVVFRCYIHKTASLIIFLLIKTILYGMLSYVFIHGFVYCFACPNSAYSAITILVSVLLQLAGSPIHTATILIFFRLQYGWYICSFLNVGSKVQCQHKFRAHKL